MFRFVSGVSIKTRKGIGRNRYASLLVFLGIVTGCLPELSTSRSSTWYGLGELSSVKGGGEFRSYSYDFVKVVTDTNARIAEDVGRVLVALRQELKDRYAIPLSDPPKTVVYVYAKRQRYDEVAKEYGLPVGKTMGCSSTRGERAIHLLFRDDRGVHPMITLLHEGTHQFLYEMDVSLSPSWRKSLKQDRLLSLPWWLHEGLATFMESAEYREGRLKVGGVNRQRLRELKKLLHQEKSGLVSTVLSAPHGNVYSSGYDAVAWGIVYALLEHAEPREASRRREAFHHYLESCRRGFLEDLDRKRTQIFGKVGEQEDATELLRQWHTWVAKNSLSTFVSTFLPPRCTIEQWERVWRREMLELED